MTGTTPKVIRLAAESFRKYTIMRMSTLLVLVLVIGIFGGYALRNWQCAELFPYSNRLACILWK